MGGGESLRASDFPETWAREPYPRSDAMPPSALLADDLADLADLTVDELLTPEDTDLEPQAILCSCCCSWCGC